MRLTYTPLPLSGGDVGERMQYYYFSTTGVLVKNVYTVRMDLTTGETDALGGWYERNY